MCATAGQEAWLGFSGWTGDSCRMTTHSDGEGGEEEQVKEAVAGYGKEGSRSTGTGLF